MKQYKSIYVYFPVQEENMEIFEFVMCDSFRYSWTEPYLKSEVTM
jgi:hypothetical protein